MTTETGTTPETQAQTPPAQTEGQPPAAAERPSWLPSKFETPEAFAASYAELEKKQSQSATPETTPAPAAAPADEAARANMAADLKAQNVNIGDFYAEYAQYGKLSEKSYEALEKAGKSREDVDGYIAGQEALIDQQVTSLHTEVGGEKRFNAIQAWAKANLSKPELEAYNQITERGSFSAIRLAVQGLNARYTQANGREPKLVGGEPPTNGEGFSSKQELTAAMRDPRYRKDPAYRDSVISKLRAGSPFR